MKTKHELCLICGRRFTHQNQKSHHHIYPRVWYHGNGDTVEMCRECHNDFEKKNPHLYVWTTQESLERFVKYCEARGIDAYFTFPHIKPTD